MGTLASIIRFAVSNFVVSRYLISTLSLLVILAYSILYLMGYVSFYGELVARLDLSIALLLVLLYILCALIVILLWAVVTRGEGARSSLARRVHRQTDTTGLHWFNLFVTLIVVFGVLSLYQQTKMERSVVTFLAFLVLAPILFDYLPMSRPRRWLVPRHVQSRQQITQTLLQGNWGLRIADLDAYNEFLIQSNPGDEQLPEGMFIEIPPR